MAAGMGAGEPEGGRAGAMGVRVRTTISVWASLVVPLVASCLPVHLPSHLTLSSGGGTLHCLHREWSRGVGSRYPPSNLPQAAICGTTPNGGNQWGGDVRLPAADSTQTTALPEGQLLVRESVWNAINYIVWNAIENKNQEGIGMA